MGNNTENAKQVIASDENIEAGIIAFENCGHSLFLEETKSLNTEPIKFAQT